jgi:hypothetical protein
MMGQLRRDYRLCKFLIDYEADSEITGVMKFVRDLKIKAHPSKGSRCARRRLTNFRRTVVD